MRDIDWDSPLSDDDKVWLRQSGMPLVEERIEANEKQFNKSRSADDLDVPPSPARSAGDPTGTLGEGPNDGSVPDGAPAGRQGVGAPLRDNDELPDEAEDYENWSKDELSEEAEDRGLSVTGTGRNGNVVKADYVKALREHDRKQADQAG